MVNSQGVLLRHPKNENKGNRDKHRINSIFAEMTAVVEISATVMILHQQEFVSEEEDRACGIVCHGWWQW
jgi:hypothetical protein